MGKSGSEYLAVIDGKVVEAPGGVYGKEIRFSEDGDHFAFVSRVRGETGKSEDDRYYAIWDGRAFPLTGAGNLVRFLGERPVFSVSGAAYAEETHYVVLGIRAGIEIEVIDNRLPGDDGKRPAQVAQ